MPDYFSWLLAWDPHLGLEIWAYSLGGVMFWFIAIPSAVVVFWTFWQVISLLVWRKQNAPRTTLAQRWANMKRGRNDFFFIWPSHKYHEFSPKPVSRSEYLGVRNGLNALVRRHEACVADFTAKLQAVCPHDDTTLEETEDWRVVMCKSHTTRIANSYTIVPTVYSPYGRLTVETCDNCGKELERKFEEYDDQTPPSKECR